MGDEDFSFEGCRDLWMRPFRDVFSASWAGSLAAVEKFVDRDSSNATARDDTQCGQDNTALHYAAARGHLDIVEYLVAQRASVNTRNSFGVNALFLAVQSQKPEVVQKLIAGSELNFVEKSTNLTVGDLCAPSEEGNDDVDEDSEAKKEEIRALLLEKCVAFSGTATVEIARVGATTVAVQWAIPAAASNALPVTKSILKVFDYTDGDEPEEPCKQHKLTTTTANATTSTGQYVHRHVVRNLRPRGRFAFSVTLKTALQDGPEGERTDPVELVREPDKIGSLECRDRSVFVRPRWILCAFEV